MPPHSTYLREEFAVAPRDKFEAEQAAPVAPMSSLWIIPNPNPNRILSLRDKAFNSLACCCASLKPRHTLALQQV